MGAGVVYKIVGKIKKGRSIVGYKVQSSTGETRELRKEQVIDMLKQGVIVNAKLRVSNGKNTVVGHNCDMRCLPVEEIGGIQSITVHLGYGMSEEQELNKLKAIAEVLSKKFGITDILMQVIGYVPTMQFTLWANGKIYINCFLKINNGYELEIYNDEGEVLVVQSASRINDIHDTLSRLTN